MGFRMYCPDESEPAPKRVWLELTCDRAGCPSVLTLMQDGYVAQRRAAVRAGWKFAADSNIYGPCCAAKHDGKVVPIRNRELER